MRWSGIPARIDSATLASFLRSFEYEVDTLKSGTDVPRWLAYNRPACIVSDLQMPGLSGLQMFQGTLDMRIRTPLLLTTAYPTAKVEAKASSMGVRAFLTKPVRARILEMRVQNAIAAHG